MKKNDEYPFKHTNEICIKGEVRIYATHAKERTINNFFLTIFVYRIFSRILQLN